LHRVCVRSSFQLVSADAKPETALYFKGCSMNLDACLLGDIEAAEDGEPVSREDEMLRVLDQLEWQWKCYLVKGLNSKVPCLHTTVVLFY
jgi:hypothetical protein